MKRKPFERALDAIDASLEEAQEYVDYFRRNPQSDEPPAKWKQTIAELRAARRVLVAAGKLHKYERGLFRQGDARDVCAAILRARKVEARRAVK